MKSKELKIPAPRNFVAKYARRVNRAAVHIDKKKEAKKTGKYFE